MTTAMTWPATSHVDYVGDTRIFYGALCVAAAVIVAGFLISGRIGRRTRRMRRHIGGLSILGGLTCLLVGWTLYETTKDYIGVPALPLFLAVGSAVAGLLAWRRPRLAAALLVVPVLLISFAFFPSEGVGALALRHRYSRRSSCRCRPGAAP